MKSKFKGPAPLLLLLTRCFQLGLQFSPETTLWLQNEWQPRQERDFWGGDSKLPLAEKS